MGWQRGLVISNFPSEVSPRKSLSRWQRLIMTICIPHSISKKVSIQNFDTAQPFNPFSTAYIQKFVNVLNVVKRSLGCWTPLRSFNVLSQCLPHTRRLARKRGTADNRPLRPRSIRRWSCPRKWSLSPGWRRARNSEVELGHGLYHKQSIAPQHLKRRRWVISLRLMPSQHNEEVIHFPRSYTKRLHQKSFIVLLVVVRMHAWGRRQWRFGLISYLLQFTNSIVRVQDEKLYGMCHLSSW